MGNSKRTVICHYHIFKNSGSTFDQLLMDNFGKGFRQFDGPFRFSKINQDELLKIALNCRASALSSHQINLPVPTSIDVRFLPVVFIRHPLLRLRSVHRFSLKAPDTTAAVAAADESFSSWVNRCKSKPQSLQALSNAQTRILSAVYGRQGIARRVARGGFEMDLDQAIRNLDHVEMLARTEFFHEDVARFPEIAARHAVRFEFSRSDAVNTTSTDLHSSVEERLENFKAHIGADCYDELIALNQQDLALYDYACTRLGQ